MSTAAKIDQPLTKTAELNIKKTFESGQCFRWNADENGIYTGIVGNKVLNICELGGDVFCDCEENDLPFWRNYFDLDIDYAAAASRFTEPEYLKVCADYGAGIRILRQDAWEALCSFIISQCNNIPRIKKIIETLCANFGEELYDGIYSFPIAEKLAPLSESELAPLRCGYRAAYILDAARAVSEGRLDFDELRNLPAEEAFSKVKEISGIGDKVANCFMLYGMHRMDRFPIDVWIKRALKIYFPDDYDPAVLGEFSGLAQQYIFFYSRTEKAGLESKVSQKRKNC